MSIKNIKESTLEDLISNLSEKEILIFLVLLGNQSLKLLELKKAQELQNRSKILT